jgi:hypothetical protein
VYKAAVDAGFKTDGVRSFNINGAWRPHPDDYAAIMRTPSPLSNRNSTHISSRALDINMINDVAVNNGGYVNHAPSSTEPDIVKQFTDKLRQETGVRQIFQPWRMLYKASNSTFPFTDNADVIKNHQDAIISRDENSILHENHLHIGF